MDPNDSSSKASEVLKVEDLLLYYRIQRGIVKAVDGLDFTLRRRTCLALVGESGCGKSSTAYSLLRLLPRNLARFEGTICVDNVETDKMDEEEFRTNVRWKVISLVPQGAMNSLNPMHKIRVQVAEPLVRGFGMENDKALELAENALRGVGVPDTAANSYPHELSGGMKQRVVIAMALVAEPKIVILDEPTSALDVMTQANVMNLLKKLKRDANLSYIFITHDLALASELADDVAVMYAGEIVETGSAESLYNSPQHPYTRKLMGAVPSLKVDKELEFIPGTAPDMLSPPSGCRFHPRCSLAMEKCKDHAPAQVEVERDHLVKCWLHVS